MAGSQYCLKLRRGEGPGGTHTRRPSASTAESALCSRSSGSHMSAAKSVTGLLTSGTSTHHHRWGLYLAHKTVNGSNLQANSEACLPLLSEPSSQGHRHISVLGTMCLNSQGSRPGGGAAVGVQRTVVPIPVGDCDWADASGHVPGTGQGWAWPRADSQCSTFPSNRRM